MMNGGLEQTFASSHHTHTRPSKREGHPACPHRTAGLCALCSARPSIPLSFRSLSTVLRSRSINTHRKGKDTLVTTQHTSIHMHSRNASTDARHPHSGRSLLASLVMRPYSSVLALVVVVVVLLAGGAAAGASNEANTQPRQRSHSRQEGIFNPNLAAAFKFGLANVASSSEGHHKRASAFGASPPFTKHGIKKNRRAPQLLSDVLGQDGAVLLDAEAAAPVNVLLEGGTLTSGSISTVRVEPTTYVTTEAGQRSKCCIHSSTPSCILSHLAHSPPSPGIHSHVRPSSCIFGHLCTRLLEDATYNLNGKVIYIKC